MTRRRVVWDVAGFVAALGLLLVTLHGLCGSAAALPHYGMFVDVDFDRGTFSGELVLLYANPAGQPVDGVFFRLYGNARSFYGTASLAVGEARVNGDPAPMSLSEADTVLQVRLPAPLAPGASVEITLSFTGKAAQSSRGAFSTDTEYGLLLKTEETLTLTAFYPIVAPITARGWAIDPVAGVGDVLFADCADYDVALRVGAGVTVVPAAGQVFAEPEGRATHVFSRTALRDFSLVLFDEARAALAKTVHGVSVQSWFPARHADAAAMALELGTAAVGTYTVTFGPLPLASVDVVEVPLQRVAGVEFSGLILVSEDYAAAPRDPFFSVIILHEMAHQWFYATVGSDPAWEPWLDEALATYASYLALADVAPPAAASLFSGWVTLYDQVRRDHPGLRATSPSPSFPDPATYSAYVYSGGALELDLVRNAIGDDSFFQGLADYYAQHALGIATSADLAQALGHACGCEIVGDLFAAQAAPEL